MPKGLTYKRAGVDIDAGNRIARRIGRLARTTFGRGVTSDIGGFAGLFNIPRGYRDPVLVASTDGVGTKLKIAFALKKFDTVGIDLVAMGVNDLIPCGARPLFFLDYIACHKVKARDITDLIKGIVKGCKQADCALIGGETAELSDLYRPEEYDLAGFVVGIAERSKVITGKNIRAGDRIIGIASSGLHSNGYTLARKVLLKSFNRNTALQMLTPTKIYVKSVLPLVNKFNIHGIAHITGGGLYDNIERILPKGVQAVICKGSWKVLEIFRRIQKKGKISDREMFRTFNMGIGMVLIVPKESERKIVRDLKKSGERAYLIGEIKKGKGVVIG